MSDFYTVSTINNVKQTNMFRKDNGNSIELNISGKTIEINKGQYLIFTTLLSLKIELVAIVSKEFFKNHFEIVGRTFVEIEYQNGNKQKWIGLLCRLNKEQSNE